jgi:hypothetical protein
VVSSSYVRCDGPREWLPVFRRLTTVALIWISLLAVALPAFACSRATCNCCPIEGSTAGGLGETGIIHPEAAAALCCVDQSEALRPVEREVRRPSHDSKFPQGSRDPAALITGLISRTALRSGELLLPPLAGFVRSDGTLTYLHTARLRL